MDSNRFVNLERIINEFSLEVLYGGTDYKNIRITVDSVDRPGLQLVGYFQHFDTSSGGSALISCSAIPFPP